ncbi:hypothetical protein [Thermosipho sp. (in: thermotogales)]|jgi:hypothetical protein|uniref:hypothetical protein n=1 Tax=Thermosipho sp. (in: thermotogales) TaxID=1968895 RepID=UPI00257F7261|nr:hypothetical protein [Thermosipho sp. (in: thermotogales)]MBZ4649211.1 hypothetical protein [Thermosipho sp. (in: thermotogales)]
MTQNQQILTTSQKEELIKYLVKFLDLKLKQDKKLELEELFTDPNPYYNKENKLTFKDGTTIEEEQYNFFWYHKLLAIYDIIINEQHYKNILERLLVNKDDYRYVSSNDADNLLIALTEEIGALHAGFGTPYSHYDILQTINDHVADHSKFLLGFALQIKLVLVVYYLTYKFGIDTSRFKNLEEAFENEGYNVDATGEYEEE